MGDQLPEKRNNKVLIITLVLFLLAASGVAGWFGNEYNQLKKETSVPIASSQQKTPSATPSPTPTPSTFSVPTSQVLPTPKSQTKWQGYINSEYGFKLKHPNLKDDICCQVSLPSSNATKIIEFAEKRTEDSFEGREPPMNGFQLYVDTNKEYRPLLYYADMIKVLLLNEYYNEGGSVALNTIQTIPISIDNTEGVIIKNLPTWSDITIISYPSNTNKYPNYNKMLIVVKNDINDREFDQTLMEILSTIEFSD